MEVTVKVDLGPRLLVVGGKPVGFCDKLEITIAEATPQELHMLAATNEIRLIKIEKEEKP